MLGLLSRLCLPPVFRPLSFGINVPWETNPPSHVPIFEGGQGGMVHKPTVPSTSIFFLEACIHTYMCM